VKLLERYRNLAKLLRNRLAVSLIIEVCKNSRSGYLLWNKLSKTCRFLYKTFEVILTNQRLTR
jgi:hypothetical protein